MRKKTHNIIPCYEYVYDGSFQRPRNPMHYFGKAMSIAVKNNSIPRTLRGVGKRRVVGRKIIEWSAYLGSYGMGGCGFFGLKLEKTKQYATEWFVLLLWSAAQWLLFDGKWVEAHPNQYHIQKPLFSSFPERKWDYLTDKLVGAAITDLLVNANSMKCGLENSGEKYLLELPENVTRLPLHGSLEPRQWFKQDNLLDAWIVTEGMLMTRREKFEGRSI
ncbi:MAG: hypothetical protein GY805_23835 [Chloroflexi bacterium]|nr:hypothetical protein [Chloroflexota bacterium]